MCWGEESNQSVCMYRRDPLCVCVCVCRRDPVSMYVYEEFDESLCVYRRDPVYMCM